MLRTCGASAPPTQTTTSGGPPTWLRCLTPSLRGADGRGPSSGRDGAGRALGWKPDTNFTDGVKRTVDRLRGILDPQPGRACPGLTAPNTIPHHPRDPDQTTNRPTYKGHVQYEPGLSPVHDTLALHLGFAVLLF